jgi:uncharacterized protein (TIRG00374 family)
LAALIAVAALAIRSSGDARAALKLTERARLWPLAAALGFQFLYYVFAGLVVRQILLLVDFRAPFWWTVHATFLLIFVSRIVPGPALTGPALMYLLLERRGLSRARSAFVGPMFFVVDYGVFFVLLAAGLLALSTRHPLTRGDLAAVPLLAIAFGILVAVLWALRCPRRIEAVLRPPARAANAALKALRLKARISESAPAQAAAAASEVRERWKSRPGLAVSIVSAGLAMLLCDVATMACVFRAFGVVLAPSTALLGFCLATVGALASILPGGLGGFEVAMVLGFVGLGAPRPAAIAATLVYRLIATWFPALPGLSAYRNLR